MMGLDIYVGSLTRYFAGDWELAALRIARELGMQALVVRPGQQEPEKKPDRGQVHELVTMWCKALAGELEGHLDAPLDWDEGPETPYFTWKPTRECYTDLLLWAAYEENADLDLPAEHVVDWKADPAWQASNAPGFVSSYCHLLNDCEWWLPNPFGFTFRALAPTMREIGFGSSTALLEQLEELNSRTWQADAKTVADWKRHAPSFPCPIEEGARYAYSIVLDLTKMAVIHKLPMLLDY